MKKYYNRLCLAFYIGFIIGSAIMLPDVPPSQEPVKVTFWGVIKIILFLAVIPCTMGFFAGKESYEHKD